MDENETDRLARRLEQRAQRLTERGAVEPSLGEIVDTAVRRLMTAIIVAGGLIGLGLYASKPETPKFQAFAAPNGQIIRVGTQSGTVLACEGRTCMTVVRRGQTLQRTLPSMETPAQRALPAPAPARPALPAPASTPAETPDETPATE
ncbi:MAG: hypothetical protein ACXWU2_09050 [Allosphingosinicella sp.]